MRWPGHKLAQHTFRKARSRWLGGIAVLGYHRVAETTYDPLGLAVSPSRFFDHMQFLARRAQVIRLSEAVQAARTGTLPRRAVVVTFDDGYRDTLEEALPIIEGARLPVTVFVSTGYTGREFWWDELTRILTNSRGLPRQLTLRIRDRMQTWSIQAQEGQWPPEHHASRHDPVVSVAAKLEALTPAERAGIMQAVRAWTAEFEGADGCPSTRALTSDEIRRLAASPHVDIGAHTVTHPMLPGLTSEEQRDEVCRSRRHLQEITGKPVTSFSYPHGAYSKNTMSIVEAAGFTAACCSEPDVVRPGCHALRLPRLWVEDHGAATFAAWLESWLQE